MQEVVEQTLRESVLEQLHLPELRFIADYTRYDRTYAGFLEIKVTEVYGSSTLPKAGDNYLICGEYTLKEHVPVKTFAAAINSISTGCEAFLTPGAGRFAACFHVNEVKEPRLGMLSLMIYSDKNAIDVHLEQAEHLRADINDRAAARSRRSITI